MSEKRIDFNKAMDEGNLDKLMEMTRKVCTSKMIRKRVKLPNYLGIEDVAQDAALKVFRSYKKFDKKKASAATYFDTVIENVIIDHVRKSQRQYKNNGFTVMGYTTDAERYALCTEGDRGMSKTEEGDFLVNLDSSINTRDEAYLLTEIMVDLNDLLDEKEKRIIFLRYKGLTHEEVGKVLGVRRTTITKTLAKIRKIMTPLLEEK